MNVSYLLQQAGDRYRDFVLIKITELSELNCTLKELIHEPTGATVMHIRNDDPENLFCLSFKTLPVNSKGTPHILEHTVLCGSRKFPVKDPFFAMTRRSLNTFMNALTGADFTCYPAASQVEKDFYNLLEVYLDAVFHPQLREVSFLQEGCRLEFSYPKDPQSPLEFKGIVFNEMKGSLNSPDARLWHALMQALCPDLPYAYNSGGDPKEIPFLTYEELIRFHETYYHPSHCLFFFYGNLPLKGHLDFILDKELKHVLKTHPLPSLPRQKRRAEIFQQTLSYPIEETQETKKKTMIAFGWLTVCLEDQETVLALSVLDFVLMNTDASPLKKLLLESGLCIHADAFIDVEMSEVPFVIICKGCEAEDSEKLKAVLFTSLEKIAEEGIPSHLIEAAIHQLEFSRTEITGDHAPFGLTLFMRSALAKQHNCPPENALLVHSLFTTLLKKAQDPTYLVSLIRKYFLENHHFVHLVMHPDPKLSLSELNAEKKLLETLENQLSEKDKKRILKQEQELLSYQEETKHQSLDLLPKVTLDDIPPLVRDFPLKAESPLLHSSAIFPSFTQAQETNLKPQTKAAQEDNLKIFHHDNFTNHILYADLIFDLPNLTLEDLPFLQLLTFLAHEIGVGERDYAANLDYLQLHVGNIGASYALHVQADNPLAMKPCVVLRGKALYRKADKLLSLLGEMATSLRFDETGRIEELIQQHYTSMHSRLTRNALRYCIQLALSGFSTASLISERVSGLSYFKMIEDLATRGKEALPPLIEKLRELKEKVFCIKSPHLVLSCDKEMYGQLHLHEFYGLGELPSKDFTPWKGDFPLPSVASQLRSIASPVAFSCQAYKTIAYIHPHSPALAIASQIMDNKILHQKIREQGGAYGVGAHFGGMLGQFYFHSFRDPNISQTLRTFNEAIDALALGHFDETDLEEAKLGIIQQLDVPIAPGNRAMTAYNWIRDGKTKEMRQNFRDRLLALTCKEVQSIVDIELRAKKDSAVIVCFAGKQLLEKETPLLALDGKNLPIHSLT